MPESTFSSPVVSPSCKFEILYCKVCDQSIDDGLEIKCDGCQKIFHGDCINDDQNQNILEKDLIQLCKLCSNKKSVCPAKSKSKLNTSIKSNASDENAYKRNLRPRANSIDSIVVSKSKSTKNGSQQFNCNDASINKIIAQYDAKMKEIESRLNVIENKSCNCNCKNEINERLTNIEGISNEKVEAWNHTSTALKHIEDDYGFLEARYYVVEREIYTLTNIVKSCNAFVETNATFDTEIQRQLDEIRYKINGGSLPSSAGSNMDFSVSKDTDIMIQMHNISLGLIELKEKQVGIETSNEVCKKTLVTLCNAIKCYNNTITTHFDLNTAYADGIINTVNSNLTEISFVNKNEKTKKKRKNKKSSEANTHTPVACSKQGKDRTTIINTESVQRMTSSCQH